VFRISLCKQVDVTREHSHLNNVAPRSDRVNQKDHQDQRSASGCDEESERGHDHDREREPPKERDRP
jgi:hypothetical protein